MQLQTQDFNALVSNTVAAIQGACNKILDFTIGSIMRATVEANSAMVLWLQGLILRVLATTRAATSSGADLDSFINDFGLTRLPAVAATGQVILSRFSATQQAVIPIGAQLQSSDGTEQFTVTLDTSNSAYSASLGGYVLAAGVSSVNAPVAAVTAGSGGNVAAGGINTLQTAIPGVDTVSNAAAFTNGADAETDTALRSRFVAWVASLSKATKDAIGYAITSVQQGLTYTPVENQTYGGVSQPGYFYVVVDDGTGSPSSTLLSTVNNAIEAVRPVTSTFGVYGPTKETANVAMTITTASGYTHSTVAGQVQTAIQSYINSLALGASLPYSRLAQLAYDASPGVTNVTNVTLNSGTSDLTATAQQVIKAGTVTIN